MVPVYQTQFGSKGNCMQAAIASILELPLDHVPDFGADRTAYEFNHALDNFLFTKGFGVVCVDVGKSDNYDPVGCYNILSGPTSPDHDRLHATVGKGNKVIHDPFPGGLLLTEIRYIEYLVPVDPAAHKGN